MNRQILEKKYTFGKFPNFLNFCSKSLNQAEDTTDMLRNMTIHWARLYRRIFL